MAEWYDDFNAMPEEERKRRHIYCQAQLDNQNRNILNPFGRNGKTKEEIRAASAKGGYNAAITKRKRKQFKEMMNELLEQPAIDKDGQEMDVTWAELITERAIQRATGYGMPANAAFEQLLAIVDEKPTDVSKTIIENMPTIKLEGFKDNAGIDNM